MRRILSVLAIVTLPAVSFAQQPASVSPDLSGKWSGYWISDKNGHTGPLHAKFTQVNAEQYKVTYRGRFALVIPFRYSTTMDVVATGSEVVVLTAEKQLGPLGSFRTTAYATNTNFDATFTSRNDRGRFVMTRR